MINSSKKRTASDYELGGKVLLRKYPKGNIFDPLYSRGASELVEIGDKGVVVREEDGVVKRTHKDDVKHYHQLPMYSDLDDTDDEEEHPAHQKTLLCKKQRTM